MHHPSPFWELLDTQEKKIFFMFGGVFGRGFFFVVVCFVLVFFFVIEKSNSTPLVRNRSTQVGAFKLLYLTVKLKVITYVRYQKPNCLCTFPSGGDWQILQQRTNAAKGAKIKWRRGGIYSFLLARL